MPISNRTFLPLAWPSQIKDRVTLTLERICFVSRFRRELEASDWIACNYGFQSFIVLVDGLVENLLGMSPIITRVAVTCTQIALSQLWKSWSVVIGNSLGEYEALEIAGLHSVLDTILLVAERAEFIISRCVTGSHAILTVHASFSRV